VTDTSPALRIQLPVGDVTPYYWRAVAYDRFDLGGWSLTDNVTVDRASDSELLDQTSERPPAQEARRALTFTVEPLEFHGSSIFSPDAPSTVDRATRVTLVGPGEYLGAVDSAGGSGPYRVTALIPTTGDATTGALTENRLRAAGQNYPSLVRALYLGIPDGAVGPDTQAILKTVRDGLSLADPYDLARATERYLRSSAFVYTTDVSGLDCGDRSVSECFAHFRRGYCQYYASLMVMMMRSAGVPARLVQGFLPGDRDPATGEEIVRFSNSHAWVEVYFPGYGWVPFDPTGGGLAQLAPLPSGAPVPMPTATIRPATSSGPRDEADPTRRAGTGAAGQANSRGAGSGPLIAIGILLAIAIALLAFAAYRRGPRGIVTAETAYGDISRLAARFGFAPRPTETVYEYTGSLAEVLPGVRPELDTVAQAKVEVSYGHRELGADRLGSLKAAQRRLRVALLRLLLRRRRPR
jgi:transglutaminase-like putative cysteine protease